MRSCVCQEMKKEVQKRRDLGKEERKVEVSSGKRKWTEEGCPWGLVGIKEWGKKEAKKTCCKCAK